jgi:hypothetical protein
MACTNQAGVFPHSNNNKLARADYLPPAKFFLGYLVPNSQLPIPPGWGCGSLVGVLAQHVQGSGNKKKNLSTAHPGDYRPHPVSFPCKDPPELRVSLRALQTRGSNVSCTLI